MSAELPPPMITIEQNKEVLSWLCSKCGRPLGQFSAQRSWDLHGEILCGKCAQEEDPGFQEWLKEQEMFKGMQEA